MQKLAAELSKRWTQADGIAPWLRRNGPRLRRMVRDGGWNWSDIGRAMTLAGITYASGTAWTGALLNVKMAQARSHLRTRNAKQAFDDRPPALPKQGRPASGQAGISLIIAPAKVPVVGGVPEPEPTFALAALAPTRFSPPAASDDIGRSNKPSSTRKRVDVDDVIRRLQGGGAQSDSEE